MPNKTNQAVDPECLCDDKGKNGHAIDCDFYKPSWEENNKTFNFIDKQINPDRQWENELDKYFIKGGKDVNEKWFKPALIKFIRQTIKQERKQAYEQGKTNGLDLRKDYNDIKPEIIKKEREEAVREVISDFEKCLYNKVQAIFISHEDFNHIKGKYKC